MGEQREPVSRLVPSRLHTARKESAGRDGYRERERKVKRVGRKRKTSSLLPSHHPLLPYLVSNPSFAACYMKTTGDESAASPLTRCPQREPACRLQSNLSRNRRRGMRFRFKQPLVGEGALSDEPKQRLERRPGRCLVARSLAAGLPGGEVTSFDQPISRQACSVSMHSLCSVYHLLFRSVNFSVCYSYFSKIQKLIAMENGSQLDVRIHFKRYNPFEFDSLLFVVSQSIALIT